MAELVVLVRGDQRPGLNPLNALLLLQGRLPPSLRHLVPQGLWGVHQLAQVPQDVRIPAGSGKATWMID